MKNVDNVVIFPMNSDAETLMLNKDLAVFNLTSIVSFIEDKTAFSKDGKIEVLENILQRQKEIDYAVFCDDIRDIGLEKIYNAFLQFCEKRIPVIFDGNLEKKLIANGFRLGNAASFTEGKEYCKPSTEKKLLTIDKPIISVMGTSSSVQKFDMQILLRRVFKSRGYKVLSFSSNSTGKLLGMNVLPDFLFYNNIALSEKILKFNNYIYDVVNKSDCDVIIIGNPGGILPYNNKITENFGEIPFIISSALQIDYTILNIGYIYKSMTDYVSAMKNLCKFRFNANIFTCCISNNRIAENDTGDSYEIYFLDDEKAKSIASEQMNDMAEDIFYWCDERKKEDILNSLVDTLEDNVDFVH